MLAKYGALLRRGIAAMFEYRASMLIWMAINVLPLVMLAVWFSMSEGGPIQGYTQSDFVSYYLLLAFVQQMTTVWVIYELAYDIRHGDLSIKLLHPLNPLHDYVSTNLADKILRPAILLPLAFLAWRLFPTIHYEVTPLRLVLFLVAIAGAWFIRFMSQYTFGLLAFWISDSMTLNDIWFALYEMLGGMVAPLDLLPPGVTAVANWLPFRFMMSFPVEIVSGRLSSTDLAAGLAAMLFWVAATFLAYRWIWQRGIKQFSAYGA
ncbi:MAG: ABC-2 family transporter protein [Chloroflexi bacterium]|nr:ABC-2 family transporter protein [Chloroflexota bacterium]